MDVGIIGGDVPMKNWSLTEWDGFDEINPVAYGEKVLVGNATCYGCLVSCKREVEVAEGPYQMKKGPGPEYETVATFGTMCLNSNMESIAKANEICNTLGMDTITCGSTIAWAIECFENGLLDESKTDGLKLNWGNHEAIIELARKIGMKEGFGELLSEGSAKASETIGGKQFLTTVRGLEAPMHDPRGAHGYGLAYATSTRGACHMDSLQYPVEGGAMLLDDIPELADQLEEMTSEGKALIVTKTQDFGQFFSHALVMCNLAGLAMNATFALRALNCAVGTNLSIDDALKIGQRIYYLKRGLNNLFGSGVEDDMLPERMMTAIEGGPTDGSVPDMKLMLEEYYALRKFNGKGWPEREKLEELGLSELAQELYKE